MMALMMVVLPVPGPPVMTMTFLSSASRTAFELLLREGYVEILLRRCEALLPVHELELLRAGEKGVHKPRNTVLRDMKRR